MCGIAGFLGNFGRECLDQMSLAIAHRGPDGSGVYHDGGRGLGLAHRRLAIIDLSDAGLQPMWDLDRRAAIVFNGEIYNFRELRRELQETGMQFRTQTDTEVILNLYLRTGVECLARLNGIYAFALWDGLKQELLVARDGLGVKPLYYADTPDGVAFASEIKALKHVPGLDRSIDVAALAQYLTYLYCPAPRTPWRGVRKLLPGEALIVGHGGIVRRWKHFRLPSFSRGSMDADSAARETKRVLARAVERQMVADVPVGAFLSGGLDSSAIVALARQHAQGGSLPCFTIAYNGPGVSSEGFAADLPYARKVADHLGVPLEVVTVGPEMTEGLENMIWHLDEPQADPAAMNAALICRRARECGIKVLLSGTGGDDVFSGYRRHYASLKERWWSWLPRIARSGLRAFSDLPPKNSALGRRFSKAFQYADETSERRLAGYFVWLRREHVLSLFSPDLRAEVERTDPLEPLLEALREIPKDTHPLNQVLYLDCKYFLTDHNLNYTDKMSMAHGVEVRVPFLDPDVMAFAASLPVHFKQHGSIGKWIFKRAMEDVLPHDVIYRPKTGFGVPLRKWMRGELRDVVDHALADDTLRRRGLFDLAAVRKLQEADRLNRIDASYPLFELLCIETWMRLFQDR